VEQRLAVIDLGSNSFRLVVFSYTEDWWKRTDEIYEPVRVGEHQETGGPLQPEPMERALETIELFAHFCRATGIERVRPLATSAIREASNRKEFVRAARTRAGLEVEVLSREQEARYGYLAVVNSTTLADGVALDIGGGSMQLTHVEDRRARAARRGRCAPSRGGTARRGCERMRRARRRSAAGPCPPAAPRRTRPRAGRPR
jgi:exopolyphosphatase/guanosine-5'-triphosphate,3'-diphosphate pyrophosphatase